MFQYDPAIMAQFPQTVGGVLMANGMQNCMSDDALLALYQTEQQATLARIGNTALSDLATLAAWRDAFRAFGVNPTKTRSAPEALLRRLTKKGDIPSINTLVDIGNLISIRYALPVAIFDTQALTGTLKVSFADGSERFTELGSDEIKHPDDGEVIFSDETGLVFARRWCWRQSMQSAAKLETSDAIIVIEAQHANAQTDIEQAQADLHALLLEFAGGTYQSAILNQEQLSFKLA